MAESKKYYWLKLTRYFFKRHDVGIIKAMGEEKGDSFVLFYVKLLVESVDHDGFLRFSEAKPYNNYLLAAATGTDIEIVNKAMELFVELGLVEILEDKTIYMTNIEKMIGSETGAAERMRRSRDKKKDETDSVTPCYTDVTPCYADVQNCYTEKDKEKKKEREGEERDRVSTAAPNKKSTNPFLDMLQNGG